jgi:hypothetical protein
MSMDRLRTNLPSTNKIISRRLAAIAAATFVGAGAVADVVEQDAPVQSADFSTATAPAAYLRSTPARVDLSSSSGIPVTLIQTQAVPAGTYLVTAKANVVNFGAADYVRCLLLAGGVQKDSGATLVGNAVPGPTGETGPSVAEIVLQTAVTFTTSTHTFALKCQHDFANSGEYVDPGASILIVSAAGPLG